MPRLASTRPVPLLLASLGLLSFNWACKTQPATPNNATEGQAQGNTRADYEMDIRRQMSRIEQRLAQERFQPTHDLTIDELEDDTYDVFRFTLRQGIEYLVVGVCDRDCSDLDFNLFDESGNQVSKDDKVDDIPVVEAQPRFDGTFILRVDMVECAQNPCLYGIEIFGR